MTLQSRWSRWKGNESSISVLRNTGEDEIGPWIDDSILTEYAGVDENGPWVNDTTTSGAGVDGTGAWVES